MNRALLLASLLVSPALALDGPVGSAAYAKRVTIPEPLFSDPDVVVLKSNPPQFEIVLKREMPTPGWQLRVDDVEVDKPRARIVARVTEIGPQQITSQVITETTLRLSIGRLEPGRYMLEIWLRRDPAGAHELAAAVFPVIASP